MRRPLHTALPATFALGLAMLVSCSSAAAAVEVGHGCTANQITTEKTMVQLAGSGQLTMPTAGVLTRWQVRGIAEFGAIPQWLKVLRPAGGQSFSVVDEEVGVIKGTTSYPTRIPVQAGDRIGLSAEGGLFFCTGTGGQIGFVAADLAKGQSAEFSSPPSELGVPVSATLEPDADGDGWGDESQDQCPRSAEVQVACPALGLDAYAVQTKGYLRVFAAVYGPGKASVDFSGSTRVPAADSDTGRAAKVSWKGARSATQGQFTNVRLKFSRNLIDALRKPGVALPIKVAVTATNVAGLKTTKTIKVKVR